MAYLASGNGTFTQYLDPMPTSAVNGSPDNVVTGDFNGDGRADLLFHWKRYGTNRLYLNSGSCTFSQYLNPIDASSINAIDSAQSEIVLGDFNGDGRSDPLFYWKQNGDARLFFSYGGGVFNEVSRDVISR